MPAGFGFEKPKAPEVPAKPTPKKLSPRMTAEQWMDLRSKIAKPDTYENPQNYKLNERDLDEFDLDEKWGDPIKNMLKTIFAHIGIKGDIEAVTNAIIEGLKANGVDTENLIKNLEANRWGFTDGKIKLLKKERREGGDKYTTVAWVEIFPWMAGAKAKHETVGMNEFNPGVGHSSYKGNPYEDESYDDNPYSDSDKESGVTSVTGRKVDILAGTVDATGFTREKRTDEWYRNKVDLAATLLAIYDKDLTRFDKNTREWIVKNEAVLRNLAKVDMTAKAFEKEYEKTPEKVFGSEGVYNLLLAFERALNSQSLIHDNYQAILDKKIDIHLAVGSRRAVRGYKMKESPTDKAA